jgi:hypothetical protein
MNNQNLYYCKFSQNCENQSNFGFNKNSRKFYFFQSIFSNLKEIGTLKIKEIHVKTMVKLSNLTIAISYSIL